MKSIANTKSWVIEVFFKVFILDVLLVGKIKSAYFKFQQSRVKDII